MFQSGNGSTYVGDNEASVFVVVGHADHYWLVLVLEGIRFALV